MNRPLRDHGALSRDQCLADHLPAEHALPAHLRAATSKEVVFERFQVENGKQFLHGRRHRVLSFTGLAAGLLQRLRFGIDQPVKSRRVGSKGAPEMATRKTTPKSEKAGNARL